MLRFLEAANELFAFNIYVGHYKSNANISPEFRLLISDSYYGRLEAMDSFIESLDFLIKAFR